MYEECESCIQEEILIDDPKEPSKYMSCTQGHIRIDVLEGPKKYALFNTYEETYLPNNVLRVINRISDQIFRSSIKNYDALASTYYHEYEIDDKELKDALEEIKNNLSFKYHPDILYIDDYYDVHYDDYLYSVEVKNILKEEIKEYIENNVKGKYLDNILKWKRKDISYLLDTNILDFNFTVRTYNALLRNEIYKLKELLKYSYEELLNMKYMNDKSCNSILHMLSIFMYLFTEIKQLNTDEYPLLLNINQIDNIEVNDKIINSIITILGLDIESFFRMGLSKDIIEELLHRGIMDVKQLIKCNNDIINDLCDKHKYKVMALKDRYYYIAYVSIDKSLVEYVEKHNIRTYDDIEHIEDINIKNKFIDIIDNINKLEHKVPMHATVIVNGRMY